ncbi:MAG: bifunctional diaminohydroxyphosphoribosylaminopyrimidine deaminase/5-amino-6-(5-phosphoribosylamino)uracil reductase RibD [Actinomycetota bacterium]|nr:bifunctional diaminohydroxyphosphoribosylaminopyrimidine deaminase/5-amino-6-(5-phosphoribosylamino)uracil reductase RibD [Actinomycetota bacterium]
MPADTPTPEGPFWDRAIQLAERGRGLVSPNPAVGCVVVRDGRVIAEGWHHRHGELHAEREALADARARGVDVRGATVYVTLEPCAHTGSQPPCADALVEAGVSEVVIGCADPTEKTHGQGPKVLRAAGIRVRDADPDAVRRCRLLVQDFLKRAATGRPLVTLKMAMSLDGKVATRTGDARWISGPESRELVHRWRAEMDAVAVGSGTFLADDPRLTARVEGDVKQPARVIFDSRARVTPEAALFEDVDSAPVVIVANQTTSSEELDPLREAGAVIVISRGADAAARFIDALDQLGELHVSSMLLEGGPTLAGVAIASGEVDRLEVFVAPLIVGGGKSALEGQGPELISEAIRVPHLPVTRVGQDVLMSATLKSW